MTPLNTIIEEKKKEFEERFGGEGRFLCQYNEHLGYADHHLVVKDFLTSAMQRAYEAGQSEERTKIREEVKRIVDTRNEKNRDTLESRIRKGEREAVRDAVLAHLAPKGIDLRDDLTIEI